MKKLVSTLLFGFCIIACCIASENINKTVTVYASLDNEEQTSSYRIGFSKTPVSTLEDIPTSLTEEDLKLSFLPGDFKGTNNNVYLFFQIISTSISVRLDLKLEPLSNGTNSKDWSVKWNRIIGFINAGILDSSKIAEGETSISTTLYTFTPTENEISIVKSLPLQAETALISKDAEGRGYEGQITLSITAV